MSGLVGELVWYCAFTAREFHECEMPLVPGTAFMISANGLELATPVGLWQLMHKLAFPFARVSCAPGVV